jgi:hypothetical protein
VSAEYANFGKVMFMNPILQRLVQFSTTDIKSANMTKIMPHAIAE